MFLNSSVTFLTSYTWWGCRAPLHELPMTPLRLPKHSIHLSRLTAARGQRTPNPNRRIFASTMSGATKYEQDGHEARDIAKHLPYFPFKGIDRFYDIGGFLYEPQVFKRIVDIFVDRYHTIGIDVIAGCVLA